MKGVLNKSVFCVVVEVEKVEGLKSFLYCEEVYWKFLQVCRYCNWFGVQFVERLFCFLINILVLLLIFYLFLVVRNKKYGVRLGCKIFDKLELE